MPVNYPQLIVFREKHGDNYYLVESKEAEYKMFLEGYKKALKDVLNELKQGEE